MAKADFQRLNYYSNSRLILQTRQGWLFLEVIAKENVKRVKSQFHGHLYIFYFLLIICSYTINNTYNIKRQKLECPSATTRS